MQSRRNYNHQAINTESSIFDHIVLKDIFVDEEINTYAKNN